MESPNVASRAKDARSGVEYIVMAYRALDAAELMQAIRMYLASTKKKPKRGTQVTIVTIIGHDGS